MKYYRIVPIIVSLLTLTPCEVSAQYDAYFSHYFDMPTSFNPASAGRHTKLNVNVAYSMNLVGFEHNPNTAYASADMPVSVMRGRHGLGAKFMSDKIGLFSHTQLCGQYNYQMKLAGGRLALGIQAGLLSESFKGSGVDVEESGDKAFSSSDVEGNALDIGAGIFYTHDSWYAGASVMHATAPLIELGETNQIQIDPTIYITGGYDIQLNNPLLSISTSMLFYTDLAAYRGDATVRVNYTYDKRKFYAGLGYSPTNSVTLYLGGTFHGIQLGYSYEAYTNGISIGNGSHELIIGYVTDVNFGPKGKNRHQSVRLL